MSPSWFRVPPEIDGEDADDSDPVLEVEEELVIAADGDGKVPGYPVWLDICPSAALWNHEPTKVTVRTGLRCLMALCGWLKLSGGVCSQWSGNVLEIHLWLERFGGVDS